MNLASVMQPNSPTNCLGANIMSMTWLLLCCCIICCIILIYKYQGGSPFPKRHEEIKTKERSQFSKIENI